MILRLSQHGTAGLHRYAAKINLHVRLDLDASQILGRKAKKEPCIGSNHMGHTAFGVLLGVSPLEVGKEDHSGDVVDLISENYYRCKSPREVAIGSGLADTIYICYNSHYIHVFSSSLFLHVLPS